MVLLSYVDENMETLVTSLSICFVLVVTSLAGVLKRILNPSLAFPVNTVPHSLAPTLWNRQRSMVIWHDRMRKPLEYTAHQRQGSSMVRQCGEPPDVRHTAVRVEQTRVQEDSTMVLKVGLSLSGVDVVHLTFKAWWCMQIKLSLCITFCFLTFDTQPSVFIRYSLCDKRKTDNVILKADYEVCFFFSLTSVNCLAETHQGHLWTLLCYSALLT